MTSPAITFRPALREDLDDLVVLLATLFALEPDFRFDRNRQKAGLIQMLADPDRSVLVAEIAAQVVGMCSGQITISTAEGGPALLVEDVVVLKQWRKLGIGSQLLKDLGDWAKERGIARMQLLADKDNANALEFYTRLGWQTTQLICLRRYTNSGRS